jgi:hypothetical protein
MTDTRTDLQRRSDSLFDSDKARLVPVVLPTRESPADAGPGTLPVLVDRVWWVTPTAAADPHLTSLPRPM